MVLSEVRHLAANGEGAHVEFKRKVRHPEKIIREIVAFANTDGGHLFIGIEDNGVLHGLKHPEDDHYVLKKAIDELIRPAVEYEVEKIKINNEAELLHYHIFRSRKKPHFAFLEPKHRFGKAYVRIEDRTVQASREIRKILKWEGKEYTGFQYGDDIQLLMKYLGTHHEITVSEYSKISHLPLKKASDILVNLTLNNVIRIIPGEEEDRFEFAE
jgi:predicted HTH transcriptional regulator